MAKINVLHLRSVFGTGGGPEKTIFLSAEKIDQERFNVHIVYLKSSNDPVFAIGEKASGKDISYHEIEDNRRFDLGAVRKIAEFIDANKIDILHCHGYKTDYYGFCIKYFLKKRVKLVTTVHGWLVKSSFSVKFYHLIDKFVLRFFDCVIAVSEGVKVELKRFLIPGNKIRVVHNAILASDYVKTGNGTLKEELKIPCDSYLIGTVGRISPEKGLDVFLKTAREIKNCSESAKVFFVVVGDGPERARMQDFLDKLVLSDCVFFVGQRNDVKNIYSSLDLLLVTSLKEGLSNVILEAQAMEVPVVATKAPGISDIIFPDKNGLLCSVGDFKCLANAVKQLIDDREKAKALAGSGRKNVEINFSFVKRMTGIEKSYEQVISQ